MTYNSYHSVTQVLSPFTDFSGIPDFVLKRAAIRGTKVHAACVAYCLGVWVVPLDKSASGYFESFREWFDAYVKEVIFCEKDLVDNVNKFKGRPDIVVKLVDENLWVVDIKTPVTEGPTWKAQCAAYRHLVVKDRERSGFISNPLTGALRINPDRAAKLIPYKYTEDDFAAFLSALNAYRYFKS